MPRSSRIKSIVNEMLRMEMACERFFSLLDEKKLPQRFLYYIKYQ